MVEVMSRSVVLTKYKLSWSQCNKRVFCFP